MTGAYFRKPLLYYYIICHCNIIWLVVNGCHEFCIFPLILGCCHHPNWRTHIFQRGGPTTNQIYIYFTTIRMRHIWNTWFQRVKTETWNNRFNDSLTMTFILTSWKQIPPNITAPSLRLRQKLRKNAGDSSADRRRPWWIWVGGESKWRCPKSWGYP